MHANPRSNESFWNQVLSRNHKMLALLITFRKNSLTPRKLNDFHLHLIRHRRELVPFPDHPPGPFNLGILCPCTRLVDTCLRSSESFP